MKASAVVCIKRCFSKPESFSWTKKIHETIVENSEIIPKDIFCLWNPGNMKMISQIMNNSKSSLCVIQCPSSAVKKNILKNKKLLSSARFKFVQNELSKQALSDLKAFMPSSVVCSTGPNKVIMLSLRMEVGAFWHVCLRAFLHNHKAFHHPCHRHHQPSHLQQLSLDHHQTSLEHHHPSTEEKTASEGEQEPLDWLHMYLLLNQTDYKALQAPSPPHLAPDSLTKHVLHSLFTHQTLLQDSDSMGNELRLVRFKLDRKRLGVGLENPKIKNNAFIPEKEKEEEEGEDEEKIERVVQGWGERVDKRRRKVIKFDYGEVVNGGEEEDGEMELMDDEAMLDEDSAADDVTSMDEVDGLLEEDDDENDDYDSLGVVDEVRGMREGLERVVKVNDPVTMDRMRVLMLLKHLEKKGRSRVVPALDSECKDLGFELIQKGAFRMTDRLADLTWEGWLRVVQIAVSHKNFGNSKLNMVMEDSLDGLNHIPDYYSRRVYSRRFHSN